jgi:hypothetical protein
VPSLKETICRIRGSYQTRSKYNTGSSTAANGMNPSMYAATRKWWLKISRMFLYSVENPDLVYNLVCSSSSILLRSARTFQVDYTGRKGNLDVVLPETTKNAFLQLIADTKLI